MAFGSSSSARFRRARSPDQLPVNHWPLRAFCSMGSALHSPWVSPWSCVAKASGSRSPTKCTGATLLSIPAVSAVTSSVRCTQNRMLLAPSMSAASAASLAFFGSEPSTSTVTIRSAGAAGPKSGSDSWADFGTPNSGSSGIIACRNLRGPRVRPAVLLRRDGASSRFLGRTFRAARGRTPAL